MSWTCQARTRLGVEVEAGIAQLVGRMTVGGGRSVGANDAEQHQVPAGEVDFTDAPGIQPGTRETVTGSRWTPRARVTTS